MKRTGSMFTYERGDVVLTPLGVGTIQTDPTPQGYCQIKLKAKVRERLITCTTFMFNKIIKKWNKSCVSEAKATITSN